MWVSLLSPPGCPGGKSDRVRQPQAHGPAGGALGGPALSLHPSQVPVLTHLVSLFT